MNPRLKAAFDEAMAGARHCMEAGELDAAFRQLERAHVLGQRHVVPHVRAHWWMLRIAVKRASLAEVYGQAVRIVLGAVGSAVGVVPVGNTGGTDISMFRRLPIEPELARLLEDSKQA